MRVRNSSHHVVFLARLYESTGRAIAVTPGVGVSVGVALMLKFLVKVYISLYLLNTQMDYVDTLHVGMV